MKTGEKGVLLVEDGKRLFARKLPHEASGYDIGTDRSVYTIPMTVSIHETSLHHEARRDIHGLPVQAGGKYYRFQIYLPDAQVTLWLTHSQDGHIAAYNTMDWMQSWKMIPLGEEQNSTELTSSHRFMLLDDTATSYVYLNEQGKLASEKQPLEHPKWTKGFLFQVKPLTSSHGDVKRVRFQDIDEKNEDEEDNSNNRQHLKPNALEQPNTLLDDGQTSRRKWIIIFCVVVLLLLWMVIE